MFSAHRKLSLKAVLPLTCLAILAGGCSESTEIRQYRVAKSDTQRTPATPSASTPTREQQMLAAIVPNKDSAWFFKLTGDPEVVNKNREQFRNIVNSVQFGANGDPSWQLTEGWTAQELGGITYANLKNSEDGLTATVTMLPFASESTEDNWRDYIVSNINRWRGQLSLAQQSWEEMQDELEEVSELSQGPAKAYFVSMVGSGSGSMGTAPFMRQFADGAKEVGAPNVTPPTTAGAPPSVAPAQTALSYTPPESWQELEASGMRRAAFAIGSGESTGEVTVIAAGGGIDANIGIWLGQVSREASDESRAAILDAADELVVNEIPTKLYTIAAKAEGGTSILVADIPWKTGESLFVKLKGDSQLVAAEREKFVGFLESIKW